MSSAVDVQDLGVESLLGDVDADALDAQEARDRLALASRYIANWYKATKGTGNQDIWWQKIDVERAKVEAAYNLASDMSSAGFLTSAARIAYRDAAAGWPGLWRELELSADTLADPSLISQAASLLEAPLAFIPTVTENVSKAIGNTLGAFFRPLVPWLILGGVVGGVYLLRKPIGKLLGEVGA